MIVMREGAPVLVLGKHIVEWSPAKGYGADHPRPMRRHTSLITPPSSVAAFREGYLPQIACT